MDENGRIDSTPDLPDRCFEAFTDETTGKIKLGRSIPPDACITMSEKSKFVTVRSWVVDEETGLTSIERAKTPTSVFNQYKAMENLLMDMASRLGSVFAFIAKENDGDEDKELLYKSVDGLKFKLTVSVNNYYGSNVMVDLDSALDEAAKYI